MSDDKQNQPTGQKIYTMGNVGANARVAQGENIKWIEGLSANFDDGEALAQQFSALLEQIQNSPDFDEDTRDLAVEKTQSVAEALTNVHESPKGLKRALLDAKGWFISAGGWVWDELSKILKSEAVQKTVSTISEIGVRTAIKSLIGVP